MLPSFVNNIQGIQINFFSRCKFPTAAVQSHSAPGKYQEGNKTKDSGWGHKGCIIWQPSSSWTCVVESLYNVISTQLALFSCCVNLL